MVKLGACKHTQQRPGARQAPQSPEPGYPCVLHNTILHNTLPHPIIYTCKSYTHMYMCTRSRLHAHVRIFLCSTRHPSFLSMISRPIIYPMYIHVPIVRTHVVMCTRTRTDRTYTRRHVHMYTCTRTYSSTSLPAEHGQHEAGGLAGPVVRLQGGVAAAGRSMCVCVRARAHASLCVVPGPNFNEKQGAPSPKHTHHHHHHETPGVSPPHSMSGTPPPSIPAKHSSIKPQHHNSSITATHSSIPFLQSTHPSLQLTCAMRSL